MKETAKDLFRNVPIADVAKYWDRRPCNIRHSTKDIGSRDYFDEVERRKYFVEPHILPFADFSKWKGKRVLEIGCGIGTDTISFARAGALVTAVDVSNESLKLARKRAEVYQLQERIAFYQIDAENLSTVVPVEPYDLVYSFGVIHHTPHPENIVGEVKKYMTPESEFRLMVYSRISYKLFWIMHEQRMWDMSRIDQVISAYSEAQEQCPITYSYTFEGAMRLLSGFRLLEIRKAHIFTWDIDSYRKHIYRKDPVWEAVPDAVIEELEKDLGWHTLIRAQLSS